MLEHYFSSRVRLFVALVGFAIGLAGCSGPTQSISSRWLDQTTNFIVDESNAGRKEHHVQSIVTIFTTFMRMADLPTLASTVSDQGLIVVPYGVQPTSQPGLKGQALHDTLTSLLKNASPEIVAYDLSKPGHIGLVLRGLNRVRVRPPQSVSILFTDLTYISIDQSKEQEWQITLVAPDTRGALAAAIQEPPFEMLIPYIQPDILPATPREVISEVAKMLNKGDAPSLARMVSEQGLAIAPYGLVTRETGLHHEALLKTLSTLFKGAETRVIAYDISKEGHIGLAIKGLKRTQVQPAIGDKVTMTSLAYMSLKLDADGIWRLWLIAPDTYGLLAEAMGKAPFERWK